MNQIKRQTIFKVFIGLICILIANSVSFAYICGNYGGRGYEYPGGKTISSIGIYIGEGAGCFLASNSDFLLFLNRIETSELNGVDYNELRAILNRVIENMEKSKSFYTTLVQIATNTPYRQSFIDGVKTFDYAGYQKQYGLNGIIFQEIALYLKNGNVTGIFSRILARTGTILDKLYSVKKEIDAETFPVIPNLWRLNQYYSETILFGQYSAEVFAKIN
ncbi:MAG TPA: hypothetical protein VK469_08495 [Candidatus Kapabacteria bacterium]|nr:hypothetical protein [Candidatus Kapabacteria bacterium]